MFFQYRCIHCYKHCLSPWLTKNKQSYSHILHDSHNKHNSYRLSLYKDKSNHKRTGTNLHMSPPNLVAIYLYWAMFWHTHPKSYIRNAEFINNNHKESDNHLRYAIDNTLKWPWMQIHRYTTNRLQWFVLFLRMSQELAISKSVSSRSQVTFDSNSLVPTISFLQIYKKKPS